MGGQPILVTGVPRSGTTWLARLLAAAPHTAMVGREPMNPRHRQYGLGGTLTGWTRLTQPTRRQARALRFAYLGINPYVYGRYGRHQLVAAAPSTRVIVKDPFALLSLAAIAGTTHARPVLVYRHPGAVLTSYRRMGWTADLAELLPTLQASVSCVPAARGRPPGLSEDAADMCDFWSGLHRLALKDIDLLPDAVVVSHDELSTCGVPAVRRLFEVCDLTWTPKVERSVTAAFGSREQADALMSAALHNFDRRPEEVSKGWRSKLPAAEAAAVEQATQDVLQDLERRRVRLA
ncbi:MAG: sulfotransferase [Nocardioidaceae bacterium]